LISTCIVRVAVSIDPARPHDLALEGLAAQLGLR
jgi:hypothetical protein